MISSWFLQFWTPNLTYRGLAFHSSSKLGLLGYRWAHPEQCWLGFNTQFDYTNLEMLHDQLTSSVCKFCILFPDHRTKQESVTMVTCRLLIQTAPCLMHCIGHINLSIHHFLDFALLTKSFVPSNSATGVILYRSCIAFLVLIHISTSR